MGTQGTDQPDDGLLVTRDVATLIDRSVWTVHALVRAGQLKVARKLDGGTGPYLFSRAAVDEYLARREAGADAEPEAGAAWPPS